MVIKCPNCLTQYKVNTSRVSKTLIKVQCPSCKKAVLFNVKTAAENEPHVVDSGVKKASMSAGDVLSESSIKRLGDMLTINVDGKQERPIVLIADDPRAFRDFLRKTLEELGCHVLVVDDGSSVEAILKRENRPHLVFMNVVLPHTMGFVLCEKIKNNPEYRGIKIVLIGAIFRIDRFRRDPSNLYGADDYIEEIIVKQDLVERVRKLLGLEYRDIKKEAAAPSDVVDHARRLARIILSDIIIYNQDKVDESIRNDTFYTLMSEEIEEGQKYYLEKIHSDRGEIQEIYDQTISEYVKRRRKELQ